MRLTRFVLLAVLGACATTGASGEGDKNLPTAGVGPFRRLEADEVRGLAPFVLDDVATRFGEPAVLREGNATLLFAIVERKGEPPSIARTRADGERTFFGAGGVPGQAGNRPAVVLVPDQPWEGGAVSGPALLRRRSGELLLFYAARDGIGVARGDGLGFRKETGPVLGADPTRSWETTSPHAPSVYELPDGRLRMFYAAGRGIGEAESLDGVRWTRRGLVLGPSPEPGSGTLLPGERPPFDTLAVGDPCVAPRVTPAGRHHVRVLYTGQDASGASAIGFAARYGDEGPLVRQPAPVYAVGNREAAPALLELADRSILYIEQERRSQDGTTTVGIAAAVAPITVRFGVPEDAPAAP